MRITAVIPRQYFATVLAEVWAHVGMSDSCWRAGIIYTRPSHLFLSCCPVSMLDQIRWSAVPQARGCNLLLHNRALPPCFLLCISDGKSTCKVSVEDSSVVYECSGGEHKTFTVSVGDESKYLKTLTQHLESLQSVPF